jgi:hypothetical protein
LKYSHANTANTTDTGWLKITYLVDILTQIQQIQQINTELLKIVAWLKYSLTNTANTTDTEWLKIAAWLKYSHANTANTTDTGWLKIAAWLEIFSHKYSGCSKYYGTHNWLAAQWLLSGGYITRLPLYSLAM